ncbi:MAG: hypothetical protein ACRD50_09110 [Candidatus Acidiferrales bacterium]
MPDLLVLILLAMAGSLAWAQQSQQMTARLQAARYNKSTEVTMLGTLQAIQVQKDVAKLRGTYLLVQSIPLTLEVHMGMQTPKSIPFSVGDTLQITGSLVQIDGRQILLAREVRSSSQMVLVRNGNGIAARPNSSDTTQGGQQ